MLSALILVLSTLIKVLLTFEDRYPNLGRTDKIKNEVLDSELGIIPISQEKWGDNGWFHFPKRLTSW